MADNNRPYAFYTVVVGIVAVFLTVGMSLWFLKTADEAMKVATPMLGIVGTIVGAFFGIQSSSTRAKEAESAKDEMHKAMNKVALATDDNTPAGQILSQFLT